jgi:outer membrane receptor for ferric coprogen and ferric-rhodotorulic acid
MSDLHHQRRLATATTRVLRPAQPAPAHHLSALALAAALASLSALPLPAHAQAQPGTERAQTYDIPAGPLEAALTRFAKTSGVLLAYTPELVRDLQSPGLQGSHAPAEALTRLLAGSGLAAATTGNGSYTLRRSQASPAPSTPASAGPVATTTLGEVRVTARAEVGSATEGTGAYTATGPSSTATGLGLSLRETPQSVSVMTRQRMDDFKLETLADVMEQTPGVAVVRQSEMTTFNVRGSTVNLQTDGSRQLTNGWGWNTHIMYSLDDLAEIDRIEVL